VIRAFPSEPTCPPERATRHSRRGATVIAGMLMVGLGIAGCGGAAGATNGAAATTTVTRAVFVAKANAICGKADPALSAAAARLATHPPAAQVAALVKTTYVPSVEAQISEIRALGTPSGDQATVTGMLGLVEADLNRLKSNPALVATDVFGDFARVAHPYGLTACAPLS